MLYVFFNSPIQFRHQYHCCISEIVFTDQIRRSRLLCYVYEQSLETLSIWRFLILCFKTVHLNPPERATAPVIYNLYICSINCLLLISYAHSFLQIMPIISNYYEVEKCVHGSWVQVVEKHYYIHLELSAVSHSLGNNNNVKLLHSLLSQIVFGAYLIDPSPIGTFRDLFFPSCADTFFPQAD